MSRRQEMRLGDAGGDRKQAALVKDVSRLVQKALLDAITLSGGSSESDCPALTVERAAAPIAPAILASAHPSPARAEARALYERCLTHYREVVRAPHDAAGMDDVGAAVAGFVAANIQALRGVSVTPAMLLRLERQLGGVVRLSSAWDSADARDRQLYFEQMAILAVLIRESSLQAVLQGRAAIDNVKRAARGYLHQLLGLDPDQLTLADDGLSLLAAPPVLAAAA